MKAAPLFSLALVLGLAASCTYLRDLVGMAIKKPKIQLSQIHVTKASLTELDLVISTVVTNTNSFDVNLAEMDYRFFVNNHGLATGSVKDLVTVHAESSTPVDIPLSIRAQEALGLISSALFSGKPLLTRWEMACKFKTTVGIIKVDFSEEKTLSL